MSTAVVSPLRQRSDYTHKHNAKTGRHGWLRLTPAYSVKVVEELISQCHRPMRIFDPFCGTATTALSAAYHGHEGVTTDINPFLVWLGQAKTAQYSVADIKSTQQLRARVLELTQSKTGVQASCPPIHNIERWWPPAELKFLCKLKGALETIAPGNSPARTLLLIAFCRTVIGLSNAAFDHQSMSFKDDRQLRLSSDVDMPTVFSANVTFVLSGAVDNPQGSSSVVLGDSRNSENVEGPFDRVITSPPYANRMSYIRELRPYMYWLGWLATGRDAGELDWLAIGGTWGIATSRLVEWKAQPDSFKSRYLDRVLDQIAHHDNKSGVLLANYVAKYFDDMWSHFKSMVPILARDAQLHYIVGNSTFYGTLLSVETLYAEMLKELGFSKIECIPIRKRNSKKELIEFDVTATWPGIRLV